MRVIWTKDMEREQLRKIQALIDETEPNSYIRFAFAGCVRMAEENIEFDFCNSFPDMIEYRDKKLEDALRDAEEKKNRVAKLEQRVSEMEAEIAVLKEERDNWENEADDAGRLYVCLETECQEKDTEIVRLKAELYDYMRKELGK